MGEWQETREAIRTLGLMRVLYYRLLYARHMRFIHRRGRHWFTDMAPIGGPKHRWCQWCGHRDMSP